MESDNEAEDIKEGEETQSLRRREESKDLSIICSHLRLI
jgi:hypothetical protein